MSASQVEEELRLWSLLEVLYDGPVFLCVWQEGGGIIHVWGRRLREEVPLTTLDLRQSVPFPFFYTSFNKREEVATLSEKPQQPVAVESAV